VRSETSGDVRADVELLAVAMLNDLERITELSLAQIQDQVPAYAKVPPETALPSMSSNMREGLEAICDPSIDLSRDGDELDLTGNAVSLELRIRAGITTSQMVQAWRIAQQVMRQEAYVIADRLGTSNEALLEFEQAGMRCADIALRKTASAYREAEIRELNRLAAEHAALRRVATLVAQGAKSDALFDAVAREVGTLLVVDYTGMIRYEPDPAFVTTMATWAAVGEHPPTPPRWRTVAGDPTAMVAESGRPARVDDWAAVPGPIAQFLRQELGVRSSVGSPIVVSGSLWGALAVHSTSGPLPPDTEARLLNFTELVATAIANANARTEVSRLAEEQAALRRVATLVASGAPPAEVFDAVVAEFGAPLKADGFSLCRYEPNGALVVLAHRGQTARRFPPGTHMRYKDSTVVAAVRRTQRPTRIARYDDTGATGRSIDGEDRAAEAVPLVGPSTFRSGVGAPVIVDGRLWGVTVANWMGADPPPAGAEQRMASFVELLATAIANADGHEQLTASRARLLTEADNARRQVARDLHDGAQQRLVHAVVTLRFAEDKLPENPDNGAALVADALDHLRRGITELRELAHGILPAALTDGGLRAGIDALVSRLELAVDVEVPDERFADDIEASAYFIVAEALTNVVKHARARSAQVRIAVDGSLLHIVVSDDGVGGATGDGRGLLGLADRASTLGGTLELDSPAGAGTVLSASLPLPAEDRRAPAGHAR
jgi:signal transduction histidine kinase